MQCKTCLIDHDPLTHQATQRVHEWLRSRLLRVMASPAQPPPVKHWEPRAKPRNEIHLPGSGPP
jgi:hypothetical protein